jgi:hypothetical protein
MGVIKRLIKGVRGLMSAFRALMPSGDENLEPLSDSNWSALTPDLVFIFKDETAIPKIITSFQRGGFLVQELEPHMFAFHCKYEILLQRVERLGWKRLTKS